MIYEDDVGSVSLGTHPQNRKKKKKKKSGRPDLDGLRREKHYKKQQYSTSIHLKQKRKVFFRNHFSATCTSSPATRSMILLVHFMNTSYICFILEKQYIIFNWSILF